MRNIRRFVQASCVLALPLLASLVGAMEIANSARLQAHMNAAKAIIAQLGPDHSLTLLRSQEDELGMTHAFFRQYYKGVRVFGGEVMTHADKSASFRPPTDSLLKGISLSVAPALPASAALAAVDRAMARKIAYAAPPLVELIVYPIKEQVKTGIGTDATAFENRVTSYRLTYLVRVKIEDQTETSHTVYVIDSTTGATVATWNDLHSANVIGAGNSQYSGAVQINANSQTSNFQLRDLTRGLTSGTFGVGNVVTDLAHGTFGSGTIYTDADNTWGDGLNYGGGSTTAANGQTAAVDAAYGIQVAWDMYANVFGRSGIDGMGKATYARVHYATNYDNAFWDDACFCMTFGDGSGFRVLTPIDVVGHELGHGVTANNGHGGLTYAGESGALNESSSDVMGTMAEFYVYGGGYAARATTIPSTGGNWTVGEQLGAAPLRYMYRPSLDGRSPDAWSSGIGSLDVHYSSGPSNRQFYFLSQGSSANPGSDFYSSFLPRGMQGIGNDKSARIHYRALTVYYTSNADYAAARAAHISAAADLYGSNSIEVRAVMNSFAAINVGAPAAGADPRVVVGVITQILLE